jgi:hypothetical protein
MTSGARIPADVDRPDALVAGLTARQLLWLASGGLAVGAEWALGGRLLPLPAFAALATPVGLAAVVLALGRLHGLQADRLALALVRHARAPRSLVNAPEGVPPLPGRAGAGGQPAPLPFPVAGVSEAGILDLGERGVAAVCRASSVAFGLRTEPEQEALVAGLSRWLNSLDGPVQVVVRAERMDVAASVAAIRAGAPSLPSPALERAAIGHATFLAGLAAERDVLRRVVLVVLRQAPGPAAAEVLSRRVEQAARALAGAGVEVAPLGADEALAALAGAVDPDAPPRPAGLARPGQVIGGRPT